MRLLFINTLLTLATFQCFAQNNPKKDRIMVLLTLLHSDSSTIKMIDDMYAANHIDYSNIFNNSSYLKSISAIVGDSSQLDEMKKMTQDTAFTNQMKRTMSAMNGSVTYSKEELKAIALQFMHEDMVAIYDKSYTIDEIEDLISFYKTATGQKVLNQMPIVQKEIFTLMQRKILSKSIK